jgi:hypothetical protein
MTLVSQEERVSCGPRSRFDKAGVYALEQTGEERVRQNGSSKLS